MSRIKKFSAFFGRMLNIKKLVFMFNLLQYDLHLSLCVSMKSSYLFLFNMHHYFPVEVFIWNLKFKFQTYALFGLVQVNMVESWIQPILNS